LKQAFVLRYARRIVGAIFIGAIVLVPLFEMKLKLAVSMPNIKFHASSADTAGPTAEFSQSVWRITENIPIGTPPVKEMLCSGPISDIYQNLRGNCNWRYERATSPKSENGTRRAMIGWEGKSTIHHAIEPNMPNQANAFQGRGMAAIFPIYCHINVCSNQVIVRATPINDSRTLENDMCALRMKCIDGGIGALTSGIGAYSGNDICITSKRQSAFHVLSLPIHGFSLIIHQFGLRGHQASLLASSPPLQNADNGEDEGKNRNPPIGRRVLTAGIGLLLSLLGRDIGDSLIRSGRLRIGRLVVLLSFLLFAGPLLLVFFTGFEWSWGWRW